MTMQPGLNPEAEQVLGDPTGAGVDSEFDLPSRSRGQIARSRFLHSWTAMGGLITFVGVVGFCYIYPHFYKWSWSFPDLKAPNVHPGQKGHLLGTDATGFDLLAQMMQGTQKDFVIVVISTAVSTSIGVLIGALAGYYNSFVDNLLMRFVDVMLAVPSLVILIVVAHQYSLGDVGLAFLIGFFAWMGLSRLIRAEFLGLREREFVEAAHAMGASGRRIIFRHLLPNVLSTILVFTTLSAATAIIAETSLTFLGYGIEPPDTSLGLLISNGVDAADTRGWLFYYPGILILVIVLSVSLIGEGVRNA
jgi:ABC-type dipeptide/oligopeptide/nickel transport system permease subunit